MGMNIGYLTAGRGPESDEWLTPFYACEPLLKYIPKDWTVWCPCDEEWSAYYNIFKEKYRHLVTNPILKEFPFITKHIPADDVWQLVYDWITKRNEPNVVDNRTDKEHIQSAGFDCKTSFRNIK